MKRWLFWLFIFVGCSRQIVDEGIVVSRRTEPAMMVKYEYEIKSVSNVYGIENENYFAIGQKVHIVKSFGGLDIRLIIPKKEPRADE